MNQARLKLLEPAEWPADMQKHANGPLGALNVMKILMHHPDLFRRWSVFANHFLFKSTLSPSIREMLILRVAWLTNCEYEWSQHEKMAAEQCRFRPAQFEAIQAGAQDSRWAASPRAMLTLADQLVQGPTVSDRCWNHLLEHWKTEQILDAIALVGNYVMLAMALNSVQVPVDDGYPAFDAATPARPAPSPSLHPPSAPQIPARIDPVDSVSASTDVRQLMQKARGNLPTVNIIDTVAHNPDLLRRWMPFFSHCLHKQTLDERRRELVILRTGWLAGSAYEWAQHVPIAMRRGVSVAEIEAIPEGPNHEIWTGSDKALLVATDALMRRFTLDDVEWRLLLSNFGPPAALDAIFTVGQYRLVAGLLAGLNVQLDGYLRFPPPLT